MTKINVLHVTQYIEIGGLETLIVEICKKMDKSRFQVSILCLGGYDENYGAELRSAGVEIDVIRKQGKFDLGFFRKVCRFITEKRIDVLHAHGGCFLYAAIFSFFAKVKSFIFTAHGMPLSNSLQAVFEDRIAALRCQEIVAVSEEIKTTLARRMPWSKSRISVLLNGIDIDRFRPFTYDTERETMTDRYGLPQGAFLVGSVGRLEPVKNYSMLLRAFAGLPVNQGRRPHLVLVGEGSCRDELESLAARLGVADRTTFLGMQYQVHEILPLLDAFVLSSLTEGTSISLLEAQACDVPAVVTDVGGNGVVIRDKQNGFVCPLNDDEAMTAALQKLQTDPDLARDMGAAARHRVLEEFDLNSMVRRYETLYRRTD